MTHEGNKNFRLSRTIHQRPSNPAIDKDSRGNPVESNYVAFVNAKVESGDAEQDWKPFWERLKSIPSIPVSYGGTYYGYGKSQIRSTGKWFKDRYGEVFDEYYLTTPKYLAKDGRVYVTTLYNRLTNADPENFKGANKSLVLHYQERERQRREELDRTFQVSLKDKNGETFEISLVAPSQSAAEGDAMEAWSNAQNHQAIDVAQVKVNDQVTYDHLIMEEVPRHLLRYS